MASVDSYNNIFGTLGTFPQSYTATTPGVVVDMLGYESLTFFVITGTVTDGLWGGDMEDSDLPGSGFVDVVDPFVVGFLPVFGASDDNSVFRVGYVGNKRYVRLNITLGTTGTAVFGVLAVQGAPRLGPTPTNV